MKHIAMAIVVKLFVAEVILQEHHLVDVMIQK